MEKKWAVLHWMIVLNFVLQILYGMIQTFFVLLPPSGQPGPLFGASQDISHELMLSRRLYAIETWIAIVGLSVYLAIVYRDYLKFEKSPEEKRDE